MIGYNYGRFNSGINCFSGVFDDHGVVSTSTSLDIEDGFWTHPHNRLFEQWDVGGISRERREAHILWSRG